MDRTNRKKLLWLLFATCIVRISFFMMLGDNLDESLQADVDNYLHLGHSLADNSVYELHGQPTAFRPVLYPALLALGLKLQLTAKVWVVILHVLLAILTVWITVLLGCHLKDAQTGLLAGGFVIIDPILLNQSVLVMTETAATFFAVLCMWRVAKLMDRPGPLNILLTGIAFGLAGYCRPTFYVFALILLILLLFVLQTSFVRRLAITFSIGCVVLIILSPWVYRNYQLFDKPVFATTHGGYTLLLGNNPLYYQQLDHTEITYSATEFDEGVRRFKVSAEPNFDFWSAEASLKNPVITRNEVERDAFTYEVALHHIRKNPIGFAKGCLARLKAFWTPLPADVQEARSDTQRYAVGIWYVLIYLLIAHFTLFHTGNWAHSGLFAGLALVVAFSLVHAFFWSNMRMRAPLIPMLSLVAAISFCSPKSGSS